MKLAFGELVRRMPKACVGNFDPAAMKTVDDLAFCARFEMDLYEEGESSDIKSDEQYAKVAKYLGLCHGNGATLYK